MSEIGERPELADDRNREDARVVEYLRLALGMSDEWARLALAIVVLRRHADEIAAEARRVDRPDT